MSFRLLVDHADLDEVEMLDYVNLLATSLKEGAVKGLGWELHEECETCSGSGYTTLYAHQSGGDIVDEERLPCKECSGTGLKDF